MKILKEGSLDRLGLIQIERHVIRYTCKDCGCEFEEDAGVISGELRTKMPGGGAYVTCPMEYCGRDCFQREAVLTTVTKSKKQLYEERRNKGE